MKQVISRVLVVTATIVGLTLGGCAPKAITKVEPAKPQQEKKPVAAAQPTPVDTTGNFSDADLDAKLQAQVKENLKTVYFLYDSYVLSEESKNKLSTASQFLQERKDLRILLEGHADERGSAEYNMGLGNNRANAVRDYLINLGLSKNRIETTSWGKERPADANCGEDDACHTLNRRVEWKVIR